MKKFYVEGQENALGHEELRKLQMTEDTLIRIDGKEEWAPAIQIEETSALVKPKSLLANSGPHWGNFQKDNQVKNGFRQYSSILWDIPWGQSWENTCANMPAIVRGHSFPHPTRCVNTGTNMWGEFDVPDTSFNTPPSNGQFIGRVVAEWLADGRTMRLLENFSFIDPHGIRWDAPAGSVVDGASIPQLFWSTIGGPFEGKYRNASVIHDIACDRKDRPWTDVHWVFHEAMLASSVDPIQAQVMFDGVWAFGPKW